MLAYVLGVRTLRLPARPLAQAGWTLLEIGGLSILFLGVNLALGLTTVVTARALTRVMLSVYVLNDPVLAGLSVMQAIVLHAWWRSAPA